MTPEQFAYWLQGFVELSNTRQFTENQTQMIKDHLALVFTKVTPERKEMTEADIAEKLKQVLEKHKQTNPHSPLPFRPYVNPNQPYCSPTTVPPWPTYPTVTCSVESGPLSLSKLA